MFKIIQISDIHIGGEYDGKFDCWGNLEKVLDSAAEKSSNILASLLGASEILVLVSGDVCDKETGAATEENYQKVDQLIKSKLHCKQVLYTVGNHDDPVVMGNALGFDPDETYGKLVSPYDNPFILFHIPTYSGHVDVKPVMEKIMDELYSVHDESVAKIPRFVFSHFPIGHVDNRFMQNGHSLENGDELAERLWLIGVKDIFCGHYHMGITSRSAPNVPWVNVCPGVQMQLDPYSKDCRCTADYPGYSVINIYPDYADVQFKYIER